MLKVKSKPNQTDIHIYPAAYHRAAYYWHIFYDSAHAYARISLVVQNIQIHMSRAAMPAVRRLKIRNTNMTKKPIGIVALEQFGDDTHNLIENCFKIDKESKPRVSSIDSNDGFGALMNNIVSSLTNQNKTSSRSHLMVILANEGSDNKLVSLDLVGFEKKMQRKPI